MLSSNFHPDKNLPDCMMPDGGECCAGHAAVCEDWHKQRAEIERLSSAKRRALAIADERTKENCALRREIAALREIASWVDTWTCNPVGSYSSHALIGLFGMTQDKLAALRSHQQERKGAGT